MAPAMSTELSPGADAVELGGGQRGRFGLVERPDASSLRTSSSTGSGACAAARPPHTASPRVTRARRWCEGRFTPAIVSYFGPGLAWDGCHLGGSFVGSFGGSFVGSFDGSFVGSFGAAASSPRRRRRLLQLLKDQHEKLLEHEAARPAAASELLDGVALRRPPPTGAVNDTVRCPPRPAAVAKTPAPRLRRRSGCLPRSGCSPRPVARPDPAARPGRALPLSSRRPSRARSCDFASSSSSSAICFQFSSPDRPARLRAASRLRRVSWSTVAKHPVVLGVMMCSQSARALSRDVHQSAPHVSAAEHELVVQPSHGVEVLCAECGAYRLMPFSRASSPAFRPCSTIRRARRRRLRSCRRRAAADSTAGRPAPARRGRPADWCSRAQVQAEIGDIDVGPLLAGLRALEHVGDVGAGVRVVDRDAASARASRSTRDRRWPACCRSRNVNDTGESGRIGLAESPHRPHAELGRAHAACPSAWRAGRECGRRAIRESGCRSRSRAGSRRTAGADTPSPPSRRRRHRTPTMSRVGRTCRRRHSRAGSNRGRRPAAAAAGRSAR